MSSSSSSASTSTGTTFGVELEFIIAWRRSSDPVPVGREDTIGKAVIVPNHINHDFWAADYIHDTVQTLLAAHLPRYDNTTANLSSIEVGQAFVDYQQWHAAHDCSIEELPNGDVAPGMYDGAHWVGIELTSPALHNRPESLAEVRHALDLLHQHFWIRVSHRVCGMHVHVGQGPAFISLRRLRRLAALLFAADRLLAQLHPQHRLTNTFCLGPSLVSNAAQGMTAQRAQDAVTHHRLERPEEQVSPGLRAALRAARPGDNDLHIPQFDRRIPYGALPTYQWRIKDNGALEIDGFGGTGFVAPTPMAAAVREILAVTRVEALGDLLETKGCPTIRLAYNFAAYTADRLRRVFPHKRTVEFRQAAGTLDADEVVLYIRVFVGLYEFAASTPNENLLAVIDRCVQASDPVPGPGQIDFDVFDLLASIGLLAEVEELQDLIPGRNHAVLDQDDPDFDDPLDAQFLETGDGDGDDGNPGFGHDDDDGVYEDDDLDDDDLDDSDLSGL